MPCDQRFNSQNQPLTNTIKDMTTTNPQQINPTEQLYNTKPSCYDFTKSPIHLTDSNYKAELSINKLYTQDKLNKKNLKGQEYIWSGPRTG
jgi:hypothetical protein